MYFIIARLLQTYFGLLKMSCLFVTYHDETFLTVTVFFVPFTQPAIPTIASNMNPTEEESNDLTTCCICMETYTEGDKHKPKFLTCSHSFCLPCIKVFVSLI